MDKEFNDKKEFSQRLVYALLQKGYKSKHASSGVAIRELSMATGISMEMARRYTLGLALPKPKIMKVIADWLGTSILWLRDGIDTLDTPQIIELPLLSWDEIDSWHPNYHCSRVHRLHVIIPISNLAFAVEILSDITPILPQGTILVIEPHKVANHKSIVLTTNMQDVVELKQLWVENGKKYLRSLVSKEDDNVLAAQTIIKGVFVAADFKQFLN